MGNSTIIGKETEKNCLSFKHDFLTGKFEILIEKFE